MINKGMMSSNTDLWATPQWLYDILDQEFHFTLDVCANKDNQKCPNYLSIVEDGLSVWWTGTCWMNPPYGRKIGEWLRHAYGNANAFEGTTVVCLIPARTDTKWWHDYVSKASEIRFLKGRIKFGESKFGAPFPSAIVVFKKGKETKVSHVEYKETE